ncbi:MAG: SDR family NAD(P)-dependent oxidoreductase, partial [Candidatus Anammoxibacter sp.]
MGKLNGKVALITGSSRGIGKAIALAFGREGANIAVCYNSRRDEAEEVKEEIDSFGTESFVLQTDISSRSSVKEALKKIDNSFGPVEILVNNAAIAQEKPFALISDEDWDRMLEVNLRGAFICA